MAFVPSARHLLSAKDLADARYFEPLDVDDLASAAGLSRAHFSREFRRACQLSKLGGSDDETCFRCRDLPVCRHTDLQLASKNTNSKVRKARARSIRVRLEST